MPSSSCIKPNNDNPSTGAAINRFPAIQWPWVSLALIIALLFVVGLGNAIADEMTVHASSKQAYLTKTTNDPSYMAAVEQATATPIVKNGMNPSSACPGADFSGFINAFSNSEALQRAFTKIPLKVITVIDPAAEPSPESSIKYLKKSQIKFPVIYTKRNLEKYGLVIKVGHPVNDAFFVIEQSAGEKNLGHYVEYKFARENECWKLSEINDQST